MKKIFLFLALFFVTFINVNAEDFVKSMQIDRTNYDEFKSDKTDYKITVDSNKSSIEFDFQFDENIYEANGTFQVIKLKYGDNDYSFKITNKESGESKTYTFKITRPDNRSSDNSLTSLTVGDNKVVLSDTNDYSVTVDGKVSSIEIKAGLPEKATFVDGYGERIGNNALKLPNPTTTVEIRVKAENESIRTYKININKTNIQSNDATLKSLKIEGVDFDFKSNTFEYNLSVKNNISKIKIEAIKNNEKANLDYTENVNLKTGINNIEIKVIAEDGTNKIYKLNITREEEIPIVKDIKITGIDFQFDSKTYDYKIETSLSKLDFNVTLGSETATCEILDNKELKNNSVIKIEAKDGENTVTYSFKIIDKEEKESEEKNESRIVTGNTSNNNFFKQNEMIISLVIFGVGTLSCLVSVLVKRKSKIM